MNYQTNNNKQSIIMKRKELEKIIREYFPSEKIDWVILGSYDNAELNINDEGVVSIGIDPPSRSCRFSFLHFNIRYSDIRLSDSDKLNGKINYFGNEPELYLRTYLIELKELTTKQ